MYKPIPFFIIVILFCSSAFAQAQPYKHQLGVRLGSADQVLASGFSYRYLINEKQAVEGILNLGNNEPAFGAVYEIFQPINGVESLKWFYGAGGYIGFKGQNNLGLTGIVGLDYIFKEVPVNLSIDWKPELNLIESVSFRASTVAVSVRFSFGKK